MRNDQGLGKWVDGLRQLPARAMEKVRTHPALTLCVFLLVLKQTGVVWYILRRPHGPANMFISMAGEALAVVGWAFVLRGWKRLGVLAAIDLAFGALLLTDLFYFRQFADLPSVGSLKHAGLVGELDGVDGILGELLHPGDLLLFAGAPLILFAGALVKRFRDGEVLPAKRALRLTGIGVMLLLGVVFTTARLRKPFGGHTMVASRLGPVGYHAYDLATWIGRDTMRRFVSIDEEIADARKYFASREPRPPSAEFGGIGKGLNVIYVQLESWQSFPLFSKDVNGKPITPHMDALIGESLYFPNFHSQIQQGTTSDAEFTTQCSMYASRTGSVYYDHAGQDFRCFPEVLREHGYRTIAMHGNRPDFWNRAAMYPSVGIDEFYDIRDFTMTQKLGMGVPDTEFFDQAVSKLEKETKPFYALLVSLSSHNPFNYPGLPRGDLDHGKFNGTRIADYLDSVHYTDEAVGVLMKRLKESGLLDKSIVVIYGDHQGVAQDSSNVGDYLGLPDYDPVKTFQLERHVPMLIRLPHGEKAGRYETVAGQIDTSPTVARLLDIPVEGTAFLGRDLLSGKPGFVAFPNGTVVTDKYLALSPDGGHGNAGCFALPGGEKAPGEACRKLEEKAQAELTVSWNMLESDLVSRVARAIASPTAVTTLGN